MTSSHRPSFFRRIHGRFNLSTAILSGMLLGLLVGLFFGEMVGWMGVIGNAVVLLLQMTILPYIVVSLLAGLGQLDLAHAKMLFSKAGLALVLLWLVGLLFIILMPLSFPVQMHASFFSTAVVTPPPPVDYWQLYIPSNPFKSMAEGAIPAVVLFAICVGVALINVRKKETLLQVLHTFSDALTRVNHAITRLLPLGVFASTASASGTMSLEQFNSLQVYLLATVVLCLLLTLVVIPQLVAAVTPFRQREIIAVSRDALITAFSTGNIFIIIPSLAEAAKKMFRIHRMREPGTTGTLDVMMPLAYSFPNIGKLTVLLFVLYAGWFRGSPLDLDDAPTFALSGLFSLFGSVYMAVPFMLDSFKLPTDMFQLFLASAFFTSKFNSLVAAMHMLVFGLLSVALMQGQLRFRPRALVRSLLLVLLFTFLSLWGSRQIATQMVADAPPLSERLKLMQIPDRVPDYVYAQIPEAYEQGGFAFSTLEVIQKRGVLRVGYTPDSVPFSFINTQGELVGMDIALAHRLAKALDVKVEFIPFRPDNLALALNRGHFDIAMAGLEIDVDQLLNVAFTRRVVELNMSLVTLDHRLKEFSSLEKIATHPGFSMASLTYDSLLEIATRQLDNIEVSTLGSYNEFFQQSGKYDTLLISAQEGYAWTILYPEYGVVVPDGNQVKSATGYAVARRNRELLEYVNAWLEVQRAHGLIAREYDYWILGKGAADSQPRWSIIRDVLGWVR